MAIVGPARGAISSRPTRSYRPRRRRAPASSALPHRPPPRQQARGCKLAQFSTIGHASEAALVSAPPDGAIAVWNPRAEVPHTGANSWEGLLLALAHEALHPSTPRTPVPVSDPGILSVAYERCEAVIAEHSKTFNMATSLLPSPKRRAIRALYAFCRVADNIVDCSDEPVEMKEARLAEWRYKSVTASPGRDDLVALAWADTRLRYSIPYTYCNQLIDGVARDLRQQKYETFDDLATYAYSVASTVGLMMLRIIGTAPGFTEEEAVPYAIKMGLALQITNILRDVGEDRRCGRVYLPANELQAWGLRDEDLAEGGTGSGPAKERRGDFMRFQVERNRALYREAWPCIQMFDRNGRFSVAAMCSLYSAILDDIVTHDYDVINRRAHVSTWGKLRRLPVIWWQNR
jgi:phytoene synthase